MNCHDVDRALIEFDGSPAVPFPAQAQDHVRSCQRCQELLGALIPSIDEGATSPTSLHQIERRILADLRPVRPLARRSYFFAAFALIFGSCVALGVYRMGAFALAIMSPFQAWIILSVLAISSGSMAYSLTNQMAPGSRHRIPPRLLAYGILILMTVAIVTLFQFQHKGDFWARNWGCIRAGTPIALLAALPFWLVLRRGAVLQPVITGGATGLLAGLVGTSVLEIHCPNLDAGHALFSHLGVSVLCAIAGLGIGLVAEIIGRRSVDRLPVIRAD